MPNALPRTVAHVVSLTVALLVATIGDEVALVAMTLQAAGSSDAALSVSLLMIVGVVPGVVLSPWVGRVLDAFPPRAVLLVTLLASAATVTLLGLATHLAVLLSCAALLGLCGAVSAGAVVVVVPLLLEGTRWSLAQGNGLLEAVRSGGFLLAPLVAGVMVARNGTTATLFADALAYGAAAAMAVALLPAGRGGATEGDGDGSAGGDRRLLDGFRLLLGQAVVARTVLSVAVVVLLTAVFNSCSSSTCATGWHWARRPTAPSSRRGVSGSSWDRRW